MRGARVAEAAHEGLYGLSRLARDEGCVVHTGCFGIKTEARSEHEGIRLVSNRVRFEEVEGVLRQVLVVWVAQKQHEDAALHHDLGGKLHMQTCALGLVQRHHLPIGSVKPDPKGDFVSNSDSRAARRRWLEGVRSTQPALRSTTAPSSLPCRAPATPRARCDARCSAKATW